MIREELKKQLVEAMKSKDEKKTATIRLINAAIKQKDIEARPSGKTDGIDDASILSLMQSMIKQRRESIDMYTKGGREDLAVAEQTEIDIIQVFLPKQMSEEEVRSAIKEIIEQTGASSIKDMGKVMGALRGKYAGQMDFGSASNLIKEALAG
ncbi:MAG: GatB/YqeY domain-containing protein [Alphaproteobacteria bacterium]|nr:GatB/YqeY domain-containing protein [Alphaproteobacteria bacterium]